MVIGSFGDNGSGARVIGSSARVIGSGARVNEFVTKVFGISIRCDD